MSNEWAGLQPQEPYLPSHSNSYVLMEHILFGGVHYLGLAGEWGTINQCWHARPRAGRACRWLNNYVAENPPSEGNKVGHWLAPRFAVVGGTLGPCLCLLTFCRSVHSQEAFSLVTLPQLGACCLS